MAIELDAERLTDMVRYAQGKPGLERQVWELIDRMGRPPQVMDAIARNGWSTPTKDKAPDVRVAPKEKPEPEEKKPASLATVCEVRGRDVFVSGGSSVIRIWEKKNHPYKAGDSVLFDADEGIIFEKMDEPLVLDGKICVVREIGETHSEIDMDGTILLVSNGSIKMEKGDRVVLDPASIVVIRNLGFPKSTDYTVEKIPDITWDDIGGLEKAKEQMIEAIELPHKQKELFEFYGKRPSRGVLLYGPPGCGKTLLAKAAANSLSKIYGAEAAATSFIYIKGPEILDKYVGASEQKVRDLFARAREHKKLHGYPAIIFIDEAESLLTARGEGFSGIVSQTVVPTFLAEMDGLDETSAMVILATNRPDVLDPAITREGRIDRKVKITRPTKESAEEIFMMNLKKVPVKRGVKRNELAKAASLAVFSHNRVLKTMAVNEEQTVNILLYHTVSGGMIAGIVDFALSLAIARDVKTKKKGGVIMQDILEAVDLIEEQNRDVNHKNVLLEMMEAA